MSTEAMKWAIEFAPPMPAQLVGTLAGLAYHADSKGCGTYPAVPRLAAYACKDARSVQRDIKKLLELGLIRLGDQRKAEHLPAGKRPPVYDLAMELTVADGRAGRDETTLASRVTLASSRRRGGRKKTSSDAEPHEKTGDVDVTRDVHVTGDAHVTDGVTPTSSEGWRPRHPNQLPEPTDEPKDTSSAPAVQEDPSGDLFDALAAKSAALHKQRGGEDSSAFAAFWTVYPKRRNKAEALTAWKNAVKSGVDPAHIAAAASAYAEERAGQDPRFTKYPTTWLDKGCYDDEPDPAPAPGRPQLRAVSGDSWHPFQNPDNHDVYDEDLI